MKCPNEQCDHDFDLDEFGMPAQDIVIVCPKCQCNIEAFWDYQPTSDGDEYPYISELWLVKQ